MQRFLIVVGISIILYMVVRLFRHLEGFTGEDKLLLDERDLNTFKGPSVREELMEREPAFIEQQLDFYTQTRAIYKAIIDIVVSASAAKKADVVAELAAQADGERPDFCSKSQVTELLDSAAADGLDPLFQCLPNHPSRYLLLLSLAAKLLQAQIESADAALGISPDMPALPIVPETGSSSRRSGSSRRSRRSNKQIEGFESATAAATATSSLAEMPYKSAYALPQEPPKLLDFPEPTTTPYKTPLENQLEAWKNAFDSDSTGRIQMYLRYCNKALKKIDTLQKMPPDQLFAKATGAASQNVERMRQAVQSQSQNFELPL
jgi:hypothetical protein